MRPRNILVGLTMVRKTARVTVVLHGFSPPVGLLRLGIPKLLHRTRTRTPSDGARFIISGLIRRRPRPTALLTSVSLRLDRQPASRSRHLANQTRPQPQLPRQRQLLLRLRLRGRPPLPRPRLRPQRPQPPPQPQLRRRQLHQDLLRHQGRTHPQGPVRLHFRVPSSVLGILVGRVCGKCFFASTART